MSVYLNEEISFAPFIAIPEARKQKKKFQEGDGGPHWRFGSYETIGMRDKHEDAHAAAFFGPGTLDGLIPEDIGHRLWTVLKNLDDQVVAKFEDGTTVSTTVYDGKRNLITATLGDACSFAAVYDNNGTVLRVVRLNSVVHKPTEEAEKKRLKEAKKKVFESGRLKGRLADGLAVCRAIGDRKSREYGLEPFSKIDITPLTALTNGLEDVGSIQIITTCDGFTDGAGKANQTKAGHEAYLLGKLRKNDKGMPEEEIAKALVHQAAINFSEDNITVVVHTLDKGCPALIGVFDGHGGTDASTCVANNIGQMFANECGLSKKAYEEQKNSVDKYKEVWNRDNGVKPYLVPLQKAITELSSSEVILPAVVESFENLLNALNEDGDKQINRDICRYFTRLAISLKKEPDNHGDIIKEAVENWKSKLSGKKPLNSKVAACIGVAIGMLVGLFVGAVLGALLGAGIGAGIGAVPGAIVGAITGMFTLTTGFGAGFGALGGGGAGFFISKQRERLYEAREDTVNNLDKGVTDAINAFNRGG